MINQVSNEILLSALSLVIAILTVVIPLSWRFISARRLRFEEAFHRESHDLKLFEALASSNPRLQLLSAGVLADRLTTNSSKNDKSEQRRIIKALIAITKDLRATPSEPAIPQEISKLVADNVVRNHQLPLQEFDLQNTRLCRAWWPNINASEVDFWRADLSFSGMRNANLQKTIFVEASLDGCVLVGANLSGANLDRASLLGTDLRKTILDRASFKGAVYDEQTKFPYGFEPDSVGMVKHCKNGEVARDTVQKYAIRCIAKVCRFVGSGTVSCF